MPLGLEAHVQGTSRGRPGDVCILTTTIENTTSVKGRLVNQSSFFCFFRFTGSKRATAYFTVKKQAEISVVG